VGVPLQPGDDHELRCPFCDEVYDARDLSQVLKDYEHQVAAGLPTTERMPAWSLPNGREAAEQNLTADRRAAD
jgi:hypothetical protein